MRVADWPEALAAFIDERRTAAFEWGANDCILFSASWIEREVISSQGSAASPATPGRAGPTGPAA